MLVNAAISAFVNVVVLAGIPFLIYFTYHRLRHKRPLREVARRAGLQPGEPKYLAYSAAFALVVVAAILIWSPPLESFLRAESPQRDFKGLGLSGTALVMALLYGVVKTGFTEELLFRGLIAGSLGRRLPLLWANLLQSVIFLLPHLLILRAAPELAALLVPIFASALFSGWVRIRSGSILGPWLAHAAANVATCLSVAVRSVA